MAGMHPKPGPIRFALPLGLALILSACSGAGPGWTYAPLGPSAPPSAAPTATPAPTGSSAATVTIELKTTAADPLAFEPKMIEVPANTVVQVNYLNDSAIPHNVNFFDGADQSAPSLGKTAIVTGPGALESVTFTTPATPGDYFFWCDVHTSAMTGMLHVTQ
jgi:plastocyanin